MAALDGSTPLDGVTALDGAAFDPPATRDPAGRAALEGVVDRRFLVLASVAGAVALAIVAIAVDALAMRGFYGWPPDALWVEVYRNDAQWMLSGLLPYRELFVEYPPLSLPTFLIPALLAGTDPDPYRRAFEALMTACGMALVPIVAWTVARLGGRRSDVIWAIVLVAATPELLGPIVLSRYDLWPALLTAAAVAALLHDRHRLAYGALALAVMAKAYPMVLAPLFVAWTWRRAGPGEAVRASAVGLGTALAVLLPFVWLDPNAALDPFLRAFDRPLQIESLGASILVGLHHVISIDPGEVALTFGSHNLTGELAAGVAQVQSAALLAALPAICLAVAWPVLRGRSMAAGRLVVGCAAMLVATVALGKVLSTQYVIWLLPAIAILPPILGLRPLLALAGIYLLTNVEFPSLYRPYVERLDPIATAVVFARDVGLVVLAVYLVIGMLRSRTPERLA